MMIGDIKLVALVRIKKKKLVYRNVIFVFRFSQNLDMCYIDIFELPGGSKLEN